MAATVANFQHSATYCDTKEKSQAQHRNLTVLSAVQNSHGLLRAMVTWLTTNARNHDVHRTTSEANNVTLTPLHVQHSMSPLDLEMHLAIGFGGAAYDHRRISRGRQGNATWYSRPGVRRSQRVGHRSSLPRPYADSP